MSSDNIIIVARNTDTGEVKLPLGDMMLYGVGSEQKVLQMARSDYGPEWSLTLYGPIGDAFEGVKKEGLKTEPAE